MKSKVSAMLFSSGVLCFFEQQLFYSFLMILKVKNSDGSWLDESSAPHGINRIT